MAKKAAETRKHSAEILDDNGTLIATPGVSAASGRAEGKGEASAEADKRDLPDPS